MFKKNKAAMLAMSMAASVIAGESVADSLKFALPANHSFFATHIYVAEELGYFDDIDIEYLIFKGGSEVAKQVANGSAEVGFAQPTEILIGNLAETGQTLPIKYWYMLETQSMNQIAVPTDSDIQSLDDIKGRAIGISRATASNVRQFKTVLARQGLNPETDVVWRPVGLGAGHIQALNEGTIDVSATNNMRHAGYIFSGIDLRVIPTKDTENLFGNGLISSTETLSDEASLAKLATIASGVAKATAHCTEQPADCVNIMFNKFPELQSGERTDEQNLAFGLGQVGARNATAALRSDQNGTYGLFPESVWTASVDFMSSTVEIPADLDVSILYTNDIVSPE